MKRTDETCLTIFFLLCVEAKWTDRGGWSGCQVVWHLVPRVMGAGAAQNCRHGNPNYATALGPGSSLG